MRLTGKEQNAIQKAFQFCLAGIPFRLFLFGSRADDHKKGGDIDLLVLVPLAQKDAVIELKNKIRINLFETIPEQRVDITVATEEEVSTDPFLRSVFPGAVLLAEIPHNPPRA